MDDEKFARFLRNKKSKIFISISLTTGGNMAEIIQPQTVITAEDALKTEIILNQVLIDILISKGIISENEMISGIKKIKKEREILANDWDSLL